jgi:N4-gp56 family major capsid protein
VSSTGITAADAWIPEVWSRRVLRDAITKSFWSRFTAASGAPVVQLLDLMTAGDIVHVPVASALSGAGKTGEQVLVGAEEALGLSTISAAPEFYRHAVSTSKLAEGRSAVSVKAEAAIQLGRWMAEKMDVTFFASAVADALPAPLAAETYSAANVYTVGTGLGGDVDDVVAANKITLSDIRKIRAILEEQQAAPLIAEDGSERFALVLHPRAMFDLLGDTTLTAQLQDAAPRGSANPLWSGSLGVVAGMALYSSVRVPIATNGNGVPCVAQSTVAFGAEAFVSAVNVGLSMTEDVTDYGMNQGVGIEAAWHGRRALEQNSLRVYSSAVAVA